MFFKYFLAGFVSKTLASFDDAVTRIPIIAHLTKTLKGRVAFSIGNLLAVTIACLLAWLFSSIFKNIPNIHLFASGLIFLLAIAVYFDFFSKKNIDKINKKKNKIKTQLSVDKFFKIIGLGFIVSLVTLIDDFMVLTPLFLGSFKSQLYAIIGIYFSTILQILVVIYLAKYLYKLKYIKEMAAGGLVILSILVYFKIF